MRNVWTRFRRAAVFVCALVGLIFLLATFSPFVRWYGRTLRGSWSEPKGDTLIVLGGSSLDGFPGRSTLLRCMYAVIAYRERGFRKIVVSGYMVGPHMRNLLIAEGVPPEVVVAEEGSRSTRENALNVKRLLSGEPGPTVLLTSDYHMFRAARAFRKAGLEAEPWPIPDALKRVGNPLNTWSAFVDEATETAKIALYKWRGWI
jgi:uncharacterized SAM-binding protein YcdF (DUF218 family)